MLGIRILDYLNNSLFINIFYKYIYIFINIYKKIKIVNNNILIINF